jgi:hypothetical protein
MRSSTLVAALLVSFAGMATSAAAAPMVELDSPPPPDRLRDAAVALGSLDNDRLVRDADYARSILADLDIVEANATQSPGLANALLEIRVLALMGTRDLDAAAAGARNLIAALPAGASGYGLLTTIETARNRPADAVAALEQAAMDLPPAQVSVLRERLNQQVVWRISLRLSDAKNDDARYRLAEALVKLQFPDPDDAAAIDSNRETAIEGRVAHNNPTGARTLAAAISAPDPLVHLLVQRRYDPLFGTPAARAQRLLRSLADFDHGTADRARPQNDQMPALA